MQIIYAMYSFLTSHAPCLFFMDWPISTVELRHNEGQGTSQIRLLY